MEIPLTPMEFARRARRLYAEREAVVDGDLRLTYGQFLERCDRWSSALQALGVGQGDRVAYIAPNTHAHLEAILRVPANRRGIWSRSIIGCSRTTSITSSTTAERRFVCAHADYLEAVDGIRDQLTGVDTFRGAGRFA